MGVAYHGTCFRWFEAGRAHYMRQRDTAYLDIERRGLHLPVVEAHAHYLKPARYDDLLTITVWIEKLGLAQLTFAYEISNNGEVLVRGLTRHASVSSAGRPIGLPDDIRQALVAPETMAMGPT